MDYKHNKKRGRFGKNVHGNAKQENEESDQQYSPLKKFKGSEEEKEKNFSEFNEDLENLVSYLEAMEKDIKSLPQNEDKSVLVENALRESKGYEVELCSRSITGHFIEYLLTKCDEPSILQQFMESFSQHKIKAFSYGSVSHITELLVKIAMKEIEKQSTSFEDDNEDGQSLFITWITEMGEFIADNFVSCLGNSSACHVSSTVIRALGGNVSEETDLSSKGAVIHKKKFFHNFSVSDESIVKERNSIILKSVPKFFIETLEKIAKALQNVDGSDLIDYVTKSSSATPIEAILRMSSKLDHKHSKKLVKKMAKNLFSVKNEGVPCAFTHKTSSYVVEKMFQSADEELQQIMWKKYFEECLESLITDPVGNFVIQRLFDVVESKSLLELMCNCTENFFTSILKCRYFGLFNAIAGACQRLSTQEALFSKSFMKCLECYEPVDRQSQLASLTLGFQVYGQPNAPLCLQGSLLLQTMLKFQKPIKVVNSMLQMRPGLLKNLACDTQGCHVLNAFFSSPSVGHQNREKLLQRFEPTIVDTACHRGGSLTLCRIWILLNMREKEILANTLVKFEERLKSTEGGFSLYKKFGLFYFDRKKDQWVDIQTKFHRSIQKKL